MLKWLLSISFLCITSLSHGELRLIDTFSNALAGSYLVIEQNKNYTLLHVLNNNAGSVGFEEISVPAARKPCQWREWIEKGAPGHNLWIRSKLNLSNCMIDESYSLTHQRWMNTNSSFLTTLLSLTFHEVPSEERRRIGPPPSYRKEDRRPFWQPRLVFEGQLVPNVAFTAYKAIWPNDGSDLACKTIEIYLPSPSEASYPEYFPYWISVEGKFGSAKVRVVDSGFDSESAKKLFAS